MREGLHTVLAKHRLKNYYGAKYIGTKDGCPWYAVPCEQFEELFLDHALYMGKTDDRFGGEIFGMKFFAVDQNSWEQEN